MCIKQLNYSNLYIFNRHFYQCSKLKFYNKMNISRLVATRKLQKNMTSRLEVILNTEADSYVEDNFILPSFQTIVLIVVAYLCVVLWWGPNFMRNREPYNVKKILLLYNGFIVLYVIYMDLIVYSIENNLTLLFYPSSYYDANKATQENICTIMWLYFVCKVIELLDTVLFVVRKKFNQVTPLHFVHHSIMVLISWIFVKYAPGTHLLGILLNSNVHIFMYTYYFLAALGPKFQKYLWWKKYMTTLQMVQFVLILIFSVSMPFVDHSPNRPTMISEIALCSTFLVLFLNFYRKTYTKKEKN